MSGPLGAWLPLATQSVIVARAPTIDDHGNDVPDWAQPPEEHEITHCIVQPQGAGLGPHEVLDELLLLAPPDADLLDTDRVTYGGVSYAVVGGVRRFATGVLDHVEATLRSITAV